MYALLRVGVGLYNVHAAAEQGLQIGHKSARKPRGCRPFDLNEEIQVTALIRLTAGEGAEDLNPSDTVFSRDAEDLFAFRLEDVIYPHWLTP